LRWDVTAAWARETFTLAQRRMQSGQVQDVSQSGAGRIHRGKLG
jgi:hypothetical protein